MAETTTPLGRSAARTISRTSLASREVSGANLSLGGLLGAVQELLPLFPIFCLPSPHSYPASAHSLRPNELPSPIAVSFSYPASSLVASSRARLPTFVQPSLFGLVPLSRPNGIPFPLPLTTFSIATPTILPPLPSFGKAPLGIPGNLIHSTKMSRLKSLYPFSGSSATRSRTSATNPSRVCRIPAGLTMCSQPTCRNTCSMSTISPRSVGFVRGCARMLV
ncbi:hypothetical protein BZA05DRAFT_454826 [Tricharina praecox]|uniref:uncharacterized protein n=1 Tax=Tricharina praecox TaxID=43433 RepID=UPI00222056BD|nr:uncharacterized protein BZA05DRAFT_454826 [Tricharina praecox]KAI5849902.1 hypothetical protein BZA05DRAFT_454826 [Tricharina praecox]